jgi:eukaryotic-like serine/threonine-protein kinase
MESNIPQSPCSSDPAVGDTIGPYRLVRQLGHGTTSRVFEVEHARIGRRAALKIVHRDGVVPGLVNRLFIEAQAVNRINHLHVVEITDILVPEAEQPHHALVMELLDGRSLADVMSSEGPLPAARFLPIASQICAGLAAVHRAGFVHRDLKPENVFLVDRVGDRDFVKLLDFGLVKALRGDVGVGKATVEGMFMGSPAYASPEQAAGKPVDQRSDIYAVGVMLYELVTGQLPFQSESIADLLMKQINGAPPRLSAELLATDLGRALDAIIQACLIKDPADRVLTAAQLSDMFGRLAAGDHATPHGVRPPRGRLLGLRGRRRAIAIAPVLALAVIGFFALRHRPAPLRPAPALAAPATTAAASATIAPAAMPASASKPEPTAQPRARRWGRAPQRLSSAMTLDPYR